MSENLRSRFDLRKLYIGFLLSPRCSGGSNVVKRRILYSTASVFLFKFVLRRLCLTAGDLLDSDVPPPLLTLCEQNDSDGSSPLIRLNERHLPPPVSAHVTGQPRPAQHSQPVVDTAPLVLRQLQREQVQPEPAGVGGGGDGELTEGGPVPGQGPLLVPQVGQAGPAALSSLHQVDTAGSPHLQEGH